MNATGLRDVAVPLLAGLLFGAGLAISGMADPQNVLDFLDVAGDHWNPRLAFVMGGAVLVTLPAFWFAGRRRRTLAGEPLTLPPRTPVTAPLAAGAAIFGIGWGLSGVCPGPALLLATSGATIPLVFLGGLLGGAVLFAVQTRRSAGSAT